MLWRRTILWALFQFRAHISIACASPPNGDVTLEGEVCGVLIIFARAAGAPVNLELCAQCSIIIWQVKCERNFPF